MSTRLRRSPLVRRIAPRAWPLLLLGLAVLSAAAFGGAVVDPRLLRITIVAAFMVLTLGLASVDPDKVLVGLMVWLAALGMLRRVLSQISAVGPADPLLLVAPFALGVLVFHAAQEGAFKDLSRLAKAVGILSVLLILGALNPLQTSITAGVVGLIFLLVPIGAFWIGRTLADHTLLSLLRVAVVAGVLGAVYGLMQTFRGFPSWDAAWIQDNGYTALSVYGKIRPFSTFSSAGEYGVFLAIALVLCLVLWAKPATLPMALALVACLAVALVYQSSRGDLVVAVVALALVTAAYSRVPSVLSLLFVAGALFGLVAGVRQLAPSTSGNSVASALVQHEVAGLSHPLNSKVSTLGSHYQELTSGMGAAFHHPLGTGIADITIAGSKFGATTQSTESDPSNMAVALGLPGLVVYLIILGLGMLRAYKLASVRRDVLALACLGILGVTLLQWLNGGQYAVAFLPWIALGWIDARSPDRSEAKNSPEVMPVKQSW